MYVSTCYCAYIYTSIPPFNSFGLWHSANGRVSHTAGTTFGQTATYSCNTWWETTLTLVKQQEFGLGVHLPVKVYIFMMLDTTVQFQSI